MHRDSPFILSGPLDSCLLLYQETIKACCVQDRQQLCQFVPVACACSHPRQELLRRVATPLNSLRLPRAPSESALRGALHSAAHADTHNLSKVVRLGEAQALHSGSACATSGIVHLGVV